MTCSQKGSMLQRMELKKSVHQWTTSPAVLPHCDVLTFSKLTDETNSMPVLDPFLYLINSWGLC